jgi:hypothetical protein
MMVEDKIVAHGVSLIEPEDEVRYQPFIKRMLLDNAPTRSNFEQTEASLLTMPQVTCPLEHRFAPGVYLREIEMPTNTLVIGAEHKTEHFNVVLSGSAYVLIGRFLYLIEAPCSFVSKPGVRKVLYIRETMRWQTIHANPSDESDIDALEESLVTVTPKQRWRELGVRGVPNKREALTDE